MCLPQVIKSFQNYRGVATTFCPTLVLEGDQLNGLRWARHVARMGEMRNIDKILIAKRDEKRPFRETQVYVTG
jgi:hypothetical protein